MQQRLDYRWWRLYCMWWRLYCMQWRLECMHVPLYQSLCQTLFILVPPASNKEHVHQTCLSCISSSLPAKSEITHTNSSHAGISTVGPSATEAEEAKQSSSPEPLQTPGNVFALFCSVYVGDISLFSWSFWFGRGVAFVCFDCVIFVWWEPDIQRPWAYRPSALPLSYTVLLQRAFEGNSLTPSSKIFGPRIKNKYAFII